MLLRTRVAAGDAVAAVDRRGVPGRGLARARDARDVRHRLPRHRLEPLLLPPEFEGHPLRKEFVLASRVAKAVAGREGAGRVPRPEGAAKRQPMRPPGVPAPGEWGPAGSDGTSGWSCACSAGSAAGRCRRRFLVLPLIVGQTEHKVMAHMQGRLGPMYAGAFHGWAQLIADGVKFVQKEDITPRAADRPVFRLAPVVALLPYLLVLLVIPLGPGGLVGQPLDIGLFFVLAVRRRRRGRGADVGVGVGEQVLACSAACAAAAQLLGYELPFVLAAASVAMAAGTLSLPGIVEAWRPWWLLWQLPAMVVFFVAGLAEIRRPPFDMPIADSELVFGYMTEYTGLRFAFFLLAEYVGIVVIAALTTVLFLGGWHGPVGRAARLAVDAAQGRSRCRSWSSGCGSPTRACARTSCSGCAGWSWCRWRWPSWC